MDDAETALFPEDDGQLGQLLKIGGAFHEPIELIHGRLLKREAIDFVDCALQFQSVEEGATDLGGVSLEALIGAKAGSGWAAKRSTSVLSSSAASSTARWTIS